MRPPRARQLARNGLVVESPFGDFTQSVVAVSSCADLDPPDIVVVACKAYGLSAALDAISPAIGSNTVILPLLNGIAHVDLIRQRLPNAKLWGGLAHIAVTLTPDGIVKHLNNLHALMFGPLDGARCTAAEEFLACFADTPIDARLRDNIIQDLWDKFVFFASLAGSTCLMRASIGVILETTKGRSLILGLLDECTRVAEAERFAPSVDQIARYRDELTETGSPFTASMLRDIERGAPTEAEHILGDMVSRAAAHGISAPLLNIAFAHLQAYESRRVAHLGT